jgi:hypothetical protein
MALADNYLYILCTRPGAVGDFFLAYSVSSSGLTLTGSGGAPPQAFDRFTVAMIPNAGNIYFVSARDSTISTIETGESYLDIAQASNGALSEDASGFIPLDNCGAQAANLDVSTSSLLVSCAPGTGTPTALIISLATPTATPTAVFVPAPTSGSVEKALLVDGYLYVLINVPNPSGDSSSPFNAFQSYSVDPSGAVTFIQQSPLVGFGPGGGIRSITAGDGHLFYSFESPQTLGGGGSPQISAGNIAASAVNDSSSAPPEGSIFFDVPAATALSSYQYRSYGTLVMPLGTPGISYGVDDSSNTSSVGLAVVGN